MLQSLVECKLPANFLIIEDSEDVSGRDLFAALLKNCGHDDTVKQINLICYENPPAFYFSKQTIKNEKIVSYNTFSDPCKWKNPSAPKQNLQLFISDFKSLSETAFFIDSLSLVAYHQGFSSMCKDLAILKRYSKKFLCVVHGDLFNPEQLEELFFLASSYIKLHSFISKNNFNELVCEVTNKKTGGKIIIQKEIFSITKELKVSSTVKESGTSVRHLSDPKKSIENLSTFKLGLCISEKEKKARDELVLPYLKCKERIKEGEIIYQLEADELEDDPDDDLDI